MAYRLAMATVSATAESGRPRTGARGRRLLVPALFALRRMQAHAQRTVVVAIGIAVGAAVLALTAVGSGAVQDRAVQRGLAQLQPSSGEGILVTRAGAAPQPAPVSAAESAPRARGAVVAETRGLAKTHGRGARATEVFRDLTLEFNAGELSAVTGPSGSGKSTLLHLLAGLDLPSGGEVIVAGTSLSGLDATGRARLRRSHIGLVTQGTDLVPFLSAQESVELSLALRGVARDEAAVRAAATLADVGLAPLAGQRVARLSMGERQRVALARALAARPALLLADEPTARLDEANARAIGLLFAELARKTETAIVCATHDPVLLEHVATEVPLATVAP